MIKKSEKITRVDASKECKENYDSATLVSITSEEEQQFVVNFRKEQGINAYTWLGGRKMGTWKWDDGSSYDYKNWHSAEEELGNDGLCNYLHTNSKWHDAKCETNGWGIQNFVCKKNRKYHMNRSFVWMKTNMSLLRYS